MNWFNGSAADLDKLKVTARQLNGVPRRKPGGTGMRRIASLIYFTVSDLVNGRRQRG
jgi:hypothetical protein